MKVLKQRTLSGAKIYAVPLAGINVKRARCHGIKQVGIDKTAIIQHWSAIGGRKVLTDSAVVAQKDKRPSFTRAILTKQHAVIGFFHYFYDGNDGSHDLLRNCTNIGTVHLLKTPIAFSQVPLECRRNVKTLLGPTKILYTKYRIIKVLLR